MNVTDQLETLILMALDANHAQPEKVVEFQTQDGVRELYDQGQLLPGDEMRPSSAYTCDMGGDRLFATTADYLVTHPAEVLGQEAEVAMLGDGVFKWRGFRRLPRAPKGVACLGRASHWYEMHVRFVAGNGGGQYFRRVVPLDRNGKVLPATVQSHVVCSPKLEGEILVLCASVIEDAHRANTMLAAVRDATEIKFPVPLDDYKEVFANREGPMAGSRRKAIIHWVSQHLRHSNRGREFAVKRHTRGVQEFDIDGLHIRLTPNGGAL